MFKKNFVRAGAAHGRYAGRDILMGAVNSLAPNVGMARACATLGVNRTGVYRADARRRHLAISPAIPSPRPAAPLAFDDTERQAVIAVLCSERFADCAPPTIYATLLDEGIYVGSVRTCIAGSPTKAKPVSDAINSGIPPTPNLNCWQYRPTRYGVGTLRS